MSRPISELAPIGEQLAKKILPHWFVLSQVPTIRLTSHHSKRKQSISLEMFVIICLVCYYYNRKSFRTHICAQKHCACWERLEEDRTISMTRRTCTVGLKQEALCWRSVRQRGNEEKWYHGNYIRWLSNSNIRCKDRLMLHWCYNLKRVRVRGFILRKTFVVLLK